MDRSRMRIKSFLLTVAGFLVFFGAGAQVLDPVKWTYEAEKIEANKYDLHFKAKIEKGWHVYSQFLPDAEIRPVPTSFLFDKNDAVRFEGKVKENGRKEEVYDPNFEMQLTYFSNQVTFTQRISLLKPVSKIGGTLEFMVCDDEKCLPPDERDFSFDVKYEKAAEKPAPENEKEPAKKDEGNITNPFTPSDEAKTNSPGGIKKPAKWTYEAKRISKDVYELRFTARIDEGWHIYGVDMPRENGPTPTSIIFEPNEGIKLIGKFQSSVAPEMKFDSTFGFDIKVHEKEVVFTQQIKLLMPIDQVKGTIEYMTCSDSEQQCIPQEESFSVDILEIHPEEADTNAFSILIGIFCKGFLGGMLALITPCVFPMIPLTVSFFTKKSGKRTKGIGNGIFFGISIIMLYVSLGLLITLLFGHDALNNLASNLYFNLACFAIFFVFALSFFGAFEIMLPSSWANRADQRSDRGGLIGIFFMALTLAIVSFSCTGLIIGSLLVDTVKGHYSGPVIGMFGFSAALAIPFTLFAIFPSWMQSLPKSGGWLNSVKVILGFIELALAFKFLSTADLVGHYDAFKREYFLALWIIIFALLGLYLLGKLRFAHDSPIEHISVTRLIFAIFSFAFTAYMIPGMWGAPLKLLSGIAPPLHYNEGFFGHSTASLPAETPKNSPSKYTGLYQAPHGLNAFFDYEEALTAARKEDKPLMIDFTGLACVNCRKMEDNVWVDPRVLQRIRDNYILVQLYTDDRRTKLPEDEVYISKFSGKKVTTLGAKWIDLEVLRFNTNSLPYYVLLDHDEQILAEPRGYDADINEYIDFLDKGKAEFQKRKSGNTALK